MKISLSFLLAVVGLFCGSLYPNLMIAPTRLEVKLEGQATESFVVVNQSADKLKIGIEAIPFGATGLSESEATKTDISKYISVNPKVISLAAGKSRVVRVTVRANQDIKKNKGEYYARLLFKTVEKEKRETAKKKDKSPKDVAMVVDLVFNVSIPVYGTVGTGTPEIKTECFIDKEGPKVKLTNSGLFRFDGNIVLYSKNKESELTKERVMMVRETSKEITLKLKPEALKDVVPLELVTMDKKKSVKLLNDNCLFKSILASTETTKDAAANKPTAKGKKVKAKAAATTGGM